MSVCLAKGFWHQLRCRLRGPLWKDDSDTGRLTCLRCRVVTLVSDKRLRKKEN